MLLTEELAFCFDFSYCEDIKLSFLGSSDFSDSCEMLIDELSYRRLTGGGVVGASVFGTTSA